LPTKSSTASAKLSLLSPPPVAGAGDVDGLGVRQFEEVAHMRLVHELGERAHQQRRDRERVRPASAGFENAVSIGTTSP